MPEATIDRTTILSASEKKAAWSALSDFESDSCDLLRRAASAMLELLELRNKRDEEAERTFVEENGGKGRPFSAPWNDLNEGMAFVAFQIDAIASRVNDELMDAMEAYSQRTREREG